MEFTNDSHLRHPEIRDFSSAKPSEATEKEYME